MFIYSNKIIRFVKEIKSAVKEILSREVGLRVLNERFYDRQQRASYPIKIVIYNNKPMLGFFDSDFYELGFHECLIHSSKEQLHQIIRHELAHYITFINHGQTVQPHAPEFRAFCIRMGWGEEVYSATTILESGQIFSEGEESSILRKVQKLMALTTSNNPHEAEQAMVKSQQLLLKHNIESHSINNENEEKIILKRIMKQKRENAKMRSIGQILKTFFITIVYNRAGEFTYLEILGSALNVEIADYVASVLDFEFENLWKQAQKGSKLKGTIAKNSFFYGIAKGYCNKIQALKKEYPSDAVNALMVIEKKLIDGQAMVYPRLGTSKSNGRYCRTSSALGEQMGKLLNINPGIERSAKNSDACIAYAG